jgi:CRISPR/Cas system CMR-associated protein Cmr3 (group 5 of RAMP superfamily)|tara:strand:- start:1522 stop:1734 length:213 start_codon:yes stop_codon:yes gene_type:complete
MKDIEYVKVEGHSHLVRDESSHGIVNTDIEQYKLTMKRRELMKTTREEINNLKSDMDDIKNMLSQLIEKV